MKDSLPPHMRRVRRLRRSSLLLTAAMIGLFIGLVIAVVEAVA